MYPVPDDGPALVINELAAKPKLSIYLLRRLSSLNTFPFIATPADARSSSLLALIVEQGTTILLLGILLARRASRQVDHNCDSISWLVEEMSTLSSPSLSQKVRVKEFAAEICSHIYTIAAFPPLKSSSNLRRRLRIKS